MRVLAMETEEVTPTKEDYLRSADVCRFLRYVACYMRNCIQKHTDKE